MALVFLSLGSNLGDREANLNLAVERIESSLGQSLLCSRLYESEPWGYESDNPYLNLVLQIDTDYKPLYILSEIKQIESLLGRNTNSQGYSDRPIDIDILLYDDLIMHTPDLTIPHLHMHERRFVLDPLNEIASDFIHPKFKVSINDLRNRLISNPI